MTADRRRTLRIQHASYLARGCEWPRPHALAQKPVSLRPAPIQVARMGIGVREFALDRLIRQSDSTEVLHCLSTPAASSSGGNALRARWLRGQPDHRLERPLTLRLRINSQIVVPAESSARKWVKPSSSTQIPPERERPKYPASSRTAASSEVRSHVGRSYGIGR